MRVRTLLSRYLLGYLLLSFSVGALAAHPGKVDFDRLSDLDDAKVVTRVDLSGWLMKLFTNAAADDQDMAIFSGIDEITVRVFEVDNPRRYQRLAASLHSELAGRGWDDLAQINDDGDVVHVMVKGSDDQLDGLTVMVVEDAGEAVFVNIVGTIDPRDLAQLMRNVNVHDSDIDIDLDW